VPNSVLNLDRLAEIVKEMPRPIPNALKVNAHTEGYLMLHCAAGKLDALGALRIVSTTIVIDNSLADGEFKKGFIRGGEFIEA
jgi:hypothetical protein